MDTFSAGFVAGVLVRWTDIIPLMGGVAIGVCISKISKASLEYMYKKALSIFLQCEQV